MEENKEPEFESIAPRDQEAMMMSMLKKMESEYGVKKLLDEEWKDFLLFGHETLSLEQIVQRYGSVLEPKQLQNIKDLINGKVS